MAVIELTAISKHYVMGQHVIKAVDALASGDVAVLDRRIEGWEVDTVNGDSISGARALVQHLINLGHRCIAVISGPLKTSNSQ